MLYRETCIWVARLTSVAGFVFYEIYKLMKNQKGFIPIIFIIIGAIAITSATFGVFKYKDEITASVVSIFKKSEIKTENQKSGEQKSPVALQPEEIEKSTNQDKSSQSQIQTPSNVQPQNRTQPSNNNQNQSSSQSDSQSQPAPTPTSTSTPTPAPIPIPISITDLCNNIDGAQSHIPAGLIAGGNGNCVVPPQSPTPTPAPIPVPQPTPTPVPTPQPESPPVPTLTTSATIQNIPDTVVSVKFSIVNTGQDILKINNLRLRLDSYDKRIEGLVLNINIKFLNSTDKDREYNFDSMFSSDTNLFNTSYSCDPQTGWNGCTRCLEKVSGTNTCKQSDIFTNEIRPNETAYIRIGFGTANSIPSNTEPFKFTLESGGIVGKTSGSILSTSDAKLESAPQPKSITASVLVKSFDSMSLPKEFVIGREQLSAVFNVSTPVGLAFKSYTLIATGDNVSNDHILCNGRDLTSGISRVFDYPLVTSGDTKLQVFCTVSNETNAGTWQIRLDSIDAVDINNAKPVIFTDLPATGDKLTIIQP